MSALPSSHKCLFIRNLFSQSDGCCCSPSIAITQDLQGLEAGSDCESEESEEEDEIPDDMKHLTPAEQQTLIKRRSAYMMGLGTIIVVIISDPMVDVLSEIGRRTNIPAFYIAFVLAPMASNASELVAAYNYAQKKTKASISISLATLLGAAIMNNTFVLGECIYYVSAC